MYRIFLICLFLPLLGFSQGKTVNKDKPNPKLAKVIFFRESNRDLRNKPSPIRIDNEYLTSLWNNSRYAYEFYPQQCVFKLATDHPVEVTLTAYAQEVYYLRISVIKIGDDYRQVMEQVEESAALKFFEENKLRNLGSYNPVVDSIRAVKTRMNWAGTDVFSLGASLGMGQGFEHTEMLSLTSGGSSRISAGGGTVLGLEAGYRFIPLFTVVGEFQVQGSTLFPPVANATATFDRIAFGLSPRYSLPFGNKFRFNIGPGIATFQSVKLRTDFTKVTNGFKGEFEYKATPGYFINADVEYYFRSCSFGFALRYSTVSYTLRKATVDGYSIAVDDPQLDYYRKFNGDGIYVSGLFRVHL